MLFLAAGQRERKRARQRELGFWRGSEPHWSAIIAFHSHTVTKPQKTMMSLHTHMTSLLWGPKRHSALHLTLALECQGHEVALSHQEKKNWIKLQDLTSFSVDLFILLMKKQDASRMHYCLENALNITYPKIYPKQSLKYGNDSF